MKTASGSFRDPSGYVYEKDGAIYRTITRHYQSHWEKVEPFLAELAKERLVVPFEDSTPIEGAWKTLKVEKLPFISYPYEWSYDQLKDAALLTLDLQKRALRQGLILKDASAYNIQFVGGKPIFIDHLSFEVWEEGAPWVAYRQFCSHFLAPLALLSSVDLQCGLLSRIWIDGIPLEVAAAMLPKSKRLNPGLNFHLFLHARMQQKYADAENHTDKVKSIKMTSDYLLNLAGSLERLILSKALQLPRVSTEWGDYYSNTNYTEESAGQKLSLVEQAARLHHTGGLAVDLGANTGRYTKLLSPNFSYVLAADIDPLAVNRHYLALKNTTEYTNILPLIMDFSNPSPGLGFNCTERPGFMERCNADFITALALIHHLRITAGIPLALIADFFASLLSDNGILVLEFIPKEDSQTKKLLALREDVFHDYTLEECLNVFSRQFERVSVTPIQDSCRTMIILKKLEVSHA